MPPVSAPSVLEDLIIENRANYPDELRTARMQPRDETATQALKDDSDRWDRLAEIAGVASHKALPGEDPVEHLHDAAVRGSYVSFVVLDAEGVPSNGFFPLHELDKSSTNVEPVVARQRLQSSPASAPGTVAHGTASTATVAQPEGTKPQGVPANYDDLNAKDAKALLSSNEPGIDPRAIANYEASRGDAARSTVLKEAEKLDLLGSAPQTPQTDPQATQPADGTGGGAGEDDDDTGGSSS
jgi:hypothetical protein